MIPVDGRLFEENTDTFIFMLLAFEYVLFGSQPLEVTALTAEYPFAVPWDLTREVRDDTFILDGPNRVMRHPPYWHLLPGVVYAISEGMIDAP